MLELGLHRDEERAFLAALKDSHRIRVRVAIANHNEKVIESLTAPQSYVLDGSIQVDTTADVTRSLSLNLRDPERKLDLTPSSAAQTSLYAGRFASVHYGAWVPELDDWIDVPVFFGPLTNLEHSGETIALEAQGKESLLLAPHHAVQGYTIGKNTRLDDAIRRVGRRAGEARFSIPKLKPRLHRPRAVRDISEPWRVITGGEEDANGKRIAGLVELGEAERHAFYDGRGRLTVRRKHRNPALTITPRMMTEPAQVSYDLLEFRNYVRVDGQRPKGSKSAVRGHASLDANHPLSPRSLGRNGEPRYLAEFVEASLDKDEECRKRAEEVLDRRAKVGIEVSVSCLPIPHLEEGDVVKIKGTDLNIDWPVKAFTIPLTADSPMTLGENRRVSTRRRRKGHRR